MTDSRKLPARRPVRSYAIRSGRLTAGQRRAIEQYWTDYVTDFEPGPLAMDRIFPNEQSLVVEIGFGSGESLLQMAREQPRTNFLGIDVYKPGIGRLLQGIAQHELKNLRLIRHDAVEVFAHGFVDACIDRVLILFPDPWPRKRHHKRRLVQADFMSLVRRRLRPGGEVHLATDWPPYLEHMMEVMENLSGFGNRCGGEGFWEKPERPLTRFELRGRRLGHEVRDLLYGKIEP